MRASLFVSCLEKYLQRVFNLVEDNRCLVEIHFGDVAILNILPVCHMIAGWSGVTDRHDFFEIIQSITMISMSFYTMITSRSGYPEYDKGPDLDEFPEVHCAKILIESLERRTWRKDLLSKYPKSVAVVTGLEVLGWYSKKGVNMNIIMPVISGDPCEVSGFIEHYQNDILELTERIEQYEYIKPIMGAIINRERATVPDSKLSLLNGPLFDAGKRCGLGTCRKNKHDAGRKLFQCSGGCGGLEYYCCKEHQKAHWRIHNHFCKSNRKT